MALILSDSHPCPFGEEENYGDTCARLRENPDAPTPRQWVGILRNCGSAAEFCPWAALSPAQCEAAVSSFDRFGTPSAEHADISHLRPHPNRPFSNGMGRRTCRENAVISFLFSAHPRLARSFSWEALPPAEVARLAEEVEWSALDNRDWHLLLREHFHPHLLEVPGFRPHFESHTALDGPLPPPSFPLGKHGGSLPAPRWRPLLPPFDEGFPWDALDGALWATLLAVSPEHAGRCDWNKLSGRDWARLLVAQPRFAPRCDPDRLAPWDWVRLLSRRPRLARRFPVRGLKPSPWAVLLARRPPLARRCDWRRFDAPPAVWGHLLARRPAFAGHCDWSGWSARDVRNFLSEAPAFADLFDLARLDGEDWVALLSSQPALESRCDWSKLDSWDWVDLLLGDDWHDGSLLRHAAHCPWTRLTERHLLQLAALSVPDGSKPNSENHVLLPLILAAIPGFGDWLRQRLSPKNPDSASTWDLLSLANTSPTPPPKEMP